MFAPTAEELIALRLQLLDAGWNVVPSSPRDKKCYVVGWSEIESNPFYIDKWARSFPAHTNTAAVGNRDYFGVDSDVLSDSDLADRIHGLALAYLGPTPFIRIGRWPKRLLVYQKKPGTIQSVSYKSAVGNGDGIEILSTSRQFTIHGHHYEAQRPYRWVGGANPLEDRPCEAPPVTQGQVDAFLDAVREIMPFAANRSGGGTADAPRHVNADGLIDDGRENFLRDCIFRAAHEIADNDDVLTAQAVAARAWELFDEFAWNGDRKYCFDKQCMEKARSLLRRLNDGRVELGGKLNQLTASTYTDKHSNTDGRTELQFVFQTYATALLRDGIETEEYKHEPVT